MLRPIALEGGISALVDVSLRRRGVLVAFTERRGGVSTGSFSALNLGTRSGDDRHLVAENRRRACAALGIPAFFAAHQMHGNVVRAVGPADAGAAFDAGDDLLPGADALVASASGMPIAVTVADCVPLALVDPGARRVAAVHAGWRGVAAGILRSALAAFAYPARIEALIGPAVGPDHYEVGPEVVEAISAEAGRASVIVEGLGKPRLDLPATVERMLRQLGVLSLQRSKLCTACEPGRFYSYRGEGRTGRQALVVVLL
ncbi:peptidoglycan editing factor PgeF [soil metagenome]